MLMMDDAMETDDIRISITWYGEFYFPKGKGHIKENDLFCCVKFLCVKMEERIKKERGMSMVVAPELSGLGEEPYSLIKATQSS